MILCSHMSNGLLLKVKLICPVRYVTIFTESFHIEMLGDAVELWYTESIMDGIEIVKTQHNSLIWLKLDHVFFF